eukprot:TRINITY_DN4780_c0_g1_i1.p1 TRINITY_DN4780_c0_g1~~TRINITY_DN4780_c0_g1_i1.p1  ORF type:complete len:263 (-),score=22.88 TRINITY_DN4780_c0_g1_i1:62-850(-)
MDSPCSMPLGQQIIDLHRHLVAISLELREALAALQRVGEAVLVSALPPDLPAIPHNTSSTPSNSNSSSSSTLDPRHISPPIRPYRHLSLSDPPFRPSQVSSAPTPSPIPANKKRRLASYDTTATTPSLATNITPRTRALAQHPQPPPDSAPFYPSKAAVSSPASTNRQRSDSPRPSTNTAIRPEGRHVAQPTQPLPSNRQLAFDPVLPSLATLFPSRPDATRNELRDQYKRFAPTPPRSFDQYTNSSSHPSTYRDSSNNTSL